MLRNLFKQMSRSYWVDPKTLTNSTVLINYPLISRLEETQMSINKIVNTPNPLTYSDKKKLINQVKILNENIVSIKRNGENNFNLHKYT